ncbi:hypothetical protein ACQPXB_10750 [Amycolatopsis sp. CA-161197]|uniref:hypothetical protein n=1 Tax=Amycolatopsis sp. CA-161197 TaxID=3239922 RepID=UPI003D92152E
MTDMICHVPRHGVVAVGNGRDFAAHALSTWTRTSVAAGALATGSVRAHVEVLRRISGNPGRAFLGGRLTAGDGALTRIDVGVSAFDAGGCEDAPTFPGALWSSPLIVGLPTEFAAAVVAGLTAGSPLPPGLLTVDQAAFDFMCPSEPMFERAAAVLGAAIAGFEPEKAVRVVVSGW